MKKLKLAAALSLTAFGASPVFAESNTATARVNVTTAIAIAPGTDLNFGNAAPGEGSKTILPGDAAASTFVVTGTAGSSYNIVLPADGAVVMKTGTGVTADQKINVTAFASLPSGTGQIGTGGSQTLQVGATRAPLTSTQVQGAYTGLYVVTVAY